MSRRKKILLLVGAGLVVAYVVFDIVAGWRLARTVHRLERQHGSFELRALAPKKVGSPSTNQAPMFRAAAEIVTLEKAQRKLLTDAVLDPEAILRDPQRAAELQSLVDDNRLVFELVTAGAARSAADWDINYLDGVHAEVPPLLKMLDATRLIAVRAVIEGRAGHADVAARLVDEGLVFSSSTRQEPMLIVQLVRIGMDRTILAALRELLVQASLGPVELDRLDRRLAEVAEDDPVGLGLRGEMVASSAVLDDLARGRGDRRPRMSGALLTRFARPLVRVEQRVALETIDELVRRHAARRPLNASEREPIETPWTVLGLAGQIVPGLVGTSLRGDASAARLALARTAVAVERFRLETGAYPTQLAELVPRHLRELPVDPFTGEPVEYSLADGAVTLRSAEGERLAKVFDLPGADQLLRWTLPDRTARSRP